MAKRLRNTLIMLGVLTGGGYLACRYGLTDEAKTSLSGAIDSARKSFERISSIVAEASGDDFDPEVPLPNVEATDRQWESLGY